MKKATNGKWRKVQLLIAVLITGTLMSASVSDHEDVITGELAFLEGEYDFIYADAGNSKGPENRNLTKAEQFPDLYTIKITSKSELILYKNGKKRKKYPFSSIKMPLLEDNTYVMFYKDREFYPLFYSGDTVHIHIFPEEYIDNYYVKRK